MNVPHIIVEVFWSQRNFFLQTAMFNQWVLARSLEAIMVNYVQAGHKVYVNVFKRELILLIVSDQLTKWWNFLSMHSIFVIVWLNGRWHTKYKHKQAV